MLDVEPAVDTVEIQAYSGFGHPAKRIGTPKKTPSSGSSRRLKSQPPRLCISTESPEEEEITRMFKAALQIVVADEGWRLRGTMRWLNTLIDGIEHDAARHTLDFCNSCLRGAAQVNFLNNPLSGACIVAAMLYQSTWTGSIGLLGLASSTATALALSLDAGAVRSGLFGYNGCDQHRGSISLL